MLLGLVSNCWRMQLDRGEPLEALLDKAQTDGWQAIELRQGCLGACEDRDTTLPNVLALEALSRRFAGLSFNLAVACPFFDLSTPLDDMLLATGIEAAKALAAGKAPHLRLVDVRTSPESASQSNLPAAAERLARLAESLAKGGGCLSLENGRQPWPTTIGLLHAAQQALGDNQRAIRLCYDPANIPGIGRPEVSQAVLDDLQTIHLGIVHFKQTLDGVSQPAVGPGEIDWQSQLRTIQELGFDGPALLELPGHEAIWENLAISREYVPL